ncbi:SymE family type I addiction module toxin [Providencia stuartii]|uniref:SymE family type I addiction module toxin n=1 Tax=Providencia TaxID=586 RepID=UPI0009B8E7DF|nr:type I addiction module toxin, SymE family [Providencia stuartii]AXO19721.1 type I addiction module toxin, SymE family [Providencia stuartii]MBN5556108.1 SymE family type I addiction module toxin [Providencia stuartii]MBN5591554.1 SymE family type I addiction module toxin [Providencia stuartii]NMT50366.1 type I addiction module toxin, SymE family [Providencia stuartii]
MAANRGKSNPSPQLTLSGKWLKDMGFEVESLFTLTRQPGQLIIRQAEGGIEELKWLNSSLNTKRGAIDRFISIH